MKKTILKKGHEVEELFIEKLEQLGIKFEQTGREHKLQDPYLSQQLSFDKTQTGFFLRFMPDFVCYQEKCFFFAEIKYGASIQKDAYEQYLAIEKFGVNIYIFFYFKEVFYYCLPSAIPFYQYPSKNGLQYHSLAKVNIPVEGIWVKPRDIRKTSEADFQKWRRFNAGSSGATFAHVCKSGLKKLSELK